MIFDTVGDRRPISTYTSVDCTGEETALSQCDSSLFNSGICQYLLVDCNPHTDIDPPNNEESTEETDTRNDDDDDDDDDDDEDSTEETGNEGNEITTKDGTANANSAGTKGSSNTDTAGIIAGVVVALFILVILTAVIILTIFLLKRKSQMTDEARSKKLQINQLYESPDTYGGGNGEILEEAHLTNPVYGLGKHPTMTQPRTDQEPEHHLENPLYSLATESNAHQPQHTDNGPEYAVPEHEVLENTQTALSANSTQHNGGASPAAPIYECAETL